MEEWLAWQLFLAPSLVALIVAGVMYSINLAECRCYVKIGWLTLQDDAQCRLDSMLLYRWMIILTLASAYCWMAVSAFYVMYGFSVKMIFLIVPVIPYLLLWVWMVRNFEQVERKMQSAIVAMVKTD